MTCRPATAALLALCLSAASAADSIPPGLYRENANTTFRQRPNDGSDEIPYPTSPSIAGEKEVCIPADSAAWLQEGIRKSTAGLYPQGLFEGRTLPDGTESRTLLNPAAVKPNLLSYHVSVSQRRNPQGQVEIYFAYDTTYTEGRYTNHVHTNRWLTYQDRPCVPAEAE